MWTDVRKRSERCADVRNVTFVDQSRAINVLWRLPGYLVMSGLQELLFQAWERRYPEQGAKSRFKPLEYLINGS